VDDLIRFVLSRWIVALVAIGLASAPLHAAARMLDAGFGVFGQAVEATHALQGIHGQPNQHHGAASPSDALGQACCHPGCIMAVLPALGSAAHALPLSKPVPVPPDLTPIPSVPSGIDRPPKHA
jgi:hypothetical protein